MFFLHDRGKALGVYVICTFFGIVIGPTFSGFIVQSADWTVQFWYVVALMGVSAILCLVILEETTWNREAPPSLQAPDLPERYFGRRAAIFLPGR
jgi:MFS family permease